MPVVSCFKIAAGLGLGLMLIGCGSDTVDPAGGGDARQERKAKELGGSPEDPAPGQWASDPNAAGVGGGGYSSGADPDRQ